MPERVIFPGVFPQCAECEFAKRAAETGKVRLPLATAITIGCEPSGGGGAKQAEGRFIEYKSRTLTVTPDKVSEGMKSEHLEGDVPTCPVDIPSSPEEYPNSPHLELVGTDLFGRGSRDKVPTTYKI